MVLGIANQKIKQWWSWAMDMWFYWVQDRVNQEQFHIYFEPSNDNLTNYFTKHHTATQHQQMQPVHNNKRASIECPVRVCWNPSLHSQCGTQLIQFRFPHGSQHAFTNDNN
jgi:hypothetical protein